MGVMSVRINMLQALLRGQEYQALGRSRGGFGTKIHAKVDAFGMPLCSGIVDLAT
jgi:hypothetical protein